MKINDANASCLMFDCLFIWVSSMLAMAALDETFDDYHYFMCGVGTLSKYLL